MNRWAIVIRRLRRLLRQLHKLLERIHLRLDESTVGIAHQLADLDAADLAELLNQLTLAEAATVVSLLPVPRAIELCDIR
jgi:Mg/Co/Ni transporter MgtE